MQFCQKSKLGALCKQTEHRLLARKMRLPCTKAGRPAMLRLSGSGRLAFNPTIVRLKPSDPPGGYLSAIRVLERLVLSGIQEKERAETVHWWQKPWPSYSSICGPRRVLSILGWSAGGLDPPPLSLQGMSMLPGEMARETGHPPPIGGLPRIIWPIQLADQKMLWLGLAGGLLGGLLARKAQIRAFTRF